MCMTDKVDCLSLELAQLTGNMRKGERSQKEYQ